MPHSPPIAMYVSSMLISPPPLRIPTFPHRAHRHQAPIQGAHALGRCERLGFGHARLLSLWRRRVRARQRDVLRAAFIRTTHIRPLLHCSCSGKNMSASALLLRACLLSPHLHSTNSRLSASSLRSPLLGSPLSLLDASSMQLLSPLQLCDCLFVFHRRERRYEAQAEAEASRGRAAAAAAPCSASLYLSRMQRLFSHRDCHCAQPRPCNPL